MDSVVGYKIEFLEFPHQSYIPSIHVSEDQEILAIQQKHAIYKVLEPSGDEPSQFMSPLLTLPKKGGWIQASCKPQRPKPV